MTAALYHEALVGRAKGAVGKGRLQQPTVSVTLDNPLCGDRVTLDIVVSDHKLAQVGHQVRGCLLCEAAAATIAESCRNQTVEIVRSVIPAVRTMMRDGVPTPTDWPALDIFTPVHGSKSRRDCVLLPFEALEKALDQLS
jgi:nitrogen fixation NifU-like protein